MHPLSAPPVQTQRHPLCAGSQICPGEEQSCKAAQHRARKPHIGSAPAELLENTKFAAANHFAIKGEVLQ